MKILALEFSSPQRSVAVAASPGGTGEVIETAPGNTMQPLGLIETALKQAGLEREQIEGLVVGLGPGPYNGIRVAIALAQGWQLATGVKLLGVSSAECIAEQAKADGVAGKVSVVIDAQRGEYYCASYDLGAERVRETSPLRLVSADEVGNRERAGELLIGPEVAGRFPGGRVVFPRAAMLGRLAEGRKDFLPGERLKPIYLRETQFVKAPPPRAI